MVDMHKMILCFYADIYILCGDIWLPHLVASSVGMTYCVTEVNALSTNCTFCHRKHLLSIFNPNGHDLSITIMTV